MLEPCIGYQNSPKAPRRRAKGDFHTISARGAECPISVAKERCSRPDMGMPLSCCPPAGLLRHRLARRKRLAVRLEQALVWRRAPKGERGSGRFQTVSDRAFQSASVICFQSSKEYVAHSRGRSGQAILRFARGKPRISSLSRASSPRCHRWHILHLSTQYFRSMATPIVWLSLGLLNLQLLKQTKAPARAEVTCGGGIRQWRLLHSLLPYLAPGKTPHGGRYPTFKVSLCGGGCVYPTYPWMPRGKRSP